MSQYTCNIRRTRAYTGVLFHRLFVSPIAYIAYVALLLPFVLQAQETGIYTTLYLITGLLLFGLHVEALYIQDELADDTEPVVDATNLGCFLTFDYVLHIRSKKHITLPGLFFAAVKAKRCEFVLHMMGSSAKECRKKYGNAIPSGNAMSFLQKALANAHTIGQNRISAPIALWTFMQTVPALQPALHSAEIDIQDMEAIVRWEKYNTSLWQSQSSYFPPKLLHSLGSIGRSWVQGYTNELDKISEDISGSIVWRTTQRGIALHQKEQKTTQQILSRSAHKNIVFVGEPGTGKTTLVENICAAVRTEEQQKGFPLSRILLLKTETLLSGAIAPDKLLLRALQKAEKSGNSIIIIENMPMFLTAADANTKAVFIRFLQSAHISVFGTSVPGAYHQHIRSNNAVDSLFEKVYLDDTSEEETMTAVMIKSMQLQKHRHKKLCITYRALKVLLQLTKRYIPTGGMPGKALDVFEDAVHAAQKQKATYILEEHIRQAVGIKAHIDVTKISYEDKGKLQQLTAALQANIIGQEQAITALVSSLKRARIDMHGGKRPMGTFLFLGPTGVGKTHTAKIIAQEYFGSPDTMIRLDMNEYGTEDSVYGLIGDPNPSSTNQGFLSQKVQQKPFSLLLLDEIEKAHPKVLNVFLQILDEGHFINTHGTKIDFRNTIIIATSNAGALFVQQGEVSKQALLDHIIHERLFSPEFLNRFDEVLLYKPMTVKEAVRIAILLLDSIIQGVAKNKGYTIQVEEAVVAEIVKHGYSTQFGAREMRRIIVQVIENYLADYVLQHTVERGDVIAITEQGIQQYLQNKKTMPEG